MQNFLIILVTVLSIVFLYSEIKSIRKDKTLKNIAGHKRKKYGYVPTNAERKLKKDAKIELYRQAAADVNNSIESRLNASSKLSALCDEKINVGNYRKLF